MDANDSRPNSTLGLATVGPGATPAPAPRSWPGGAHHRSYGGCREQDGQCSAMAMTSSISLGVSCQSPLVAFDIA